jgi:hypothetical protein
MQLSAINVKKTIKVAFSSCREFGLIAFKLFYKQQGKMVKLFLCLTKHHAMKTYWGVEV